MSVRPWSFVSCAAALAVLPIGLHPAPTTYKYKIHQETVNDVDATAVGGAKQSTTAASSIYLTVTLNDTAGGRTVHLVIDSMTTDSAADQAKAMMKAAADSMKGKAFHAYLPKDGKITGIKSMANDSGTVTRAEGLLETLFPKISASVKPGDTWSDTTTKTNPMGQGGSMKITSVTNYKAVASEKDGSDKAMRVQAATNMTISGQVGPQTIEGDGQGQSSLLVSPMGRTISGNGTSTMNLQVSVPQAPEPIPVSVRQTSTIMPLK